MSNALQTTFLLKEKLEKMLSNYDELEDRNEFLQNDNKKLRIKVEQKEQQITNLKEQVELLKVAKTIKGSKKNVRETKLRINTLIREIDKCIIQLNS